MNEVETREEKLNKLLNLEQRLSAIKADKKASMRTFNEEIKVVQDEIKEIVEDLGGK